MELASYQPYRDYSFEADPRFLENLCTPGFVDYYRSFGEISFLHLHGRYLAASLLFAL
jgi:hypothetical protein